MALCHTGRITEVTSMEAVTCPIYVKRAIAYYTNSQRDTSHAASHHPYYIPWWSITSLQRGVYRNMHDIFTWKSAPGPLHQLNHRVRMKHLRSLEEARAKCDFWKRQIYSVASAAPQRWAVVTESSIKYIYTPLIFHHSQTSTMSLLHKKATALEATHFTLGL